jgi:hypothetical protein
MTLTERKKQRRTNDISATQLEVTTTAKCQRRKRDRHAAKLPQYKSETKGDLQRRDWRQSTMQDV